MMDQKPKLAVLGLGTMGRAMAQTAHRSGVPLAVWNRDPAATQAFAEMGVEVARSVTEAAESADVIITMVTNADAVRSIANEQGLLEALRPGAAWAQMSTIGVEATEQLSALLATRRPDVMFVDVPVSGSKVPAENATLLIFASGPDEALTTGSARLRHDRTTDHLARSVRERLSDEAREQRAACLHCRGRREFLGAGAPVGAPTPTVADAFDGGPLISAWESAKLSRIAEGDYSAEFALVLALKDVHLALSDGGPERFKVLAALATEWEEIVDRGFGLEDVTVVTRALSG